MTGATCGAGEAHSSGTADLTFGLCESSWWFPFFVGVTSFLSFVFLSGLLIFDCVLDVDCVVICIHFYFFYFKVHFE